MTDNAKRARIAYDSFRGGFEHDGVVPHWDDAPAWVRDVVIVAYLQGMLDSDERLRAENIKLRPPPPEPSVPFKRG